jgi:hypothetical protein
MNERMKWTMVWASTTSTTTIMCCVCEADSDAC